MSGTLAGAVLAAVSPFDGPRCPRCAVPLLVWHSHRTGLWRANHPSLECGFEMGTWGYFKTEGALKEAIATGEAPRLASPEALEVVAGWIERGMMIVARKKTQEG